MPPGPLIDTQVYSLKLPLHHSLPHPQLYAMLYLHSIVFTIHLLKLMEIKWMAKSAMLQTMK